MIDRKYAIALAVLSIICLLVALKTTPQQDYSSIIHSLSIGFVISAIFYFVVVYIPGLRRRNMIHDGLGKQYDEFRRSCIDTFLIISNSQEYSHREALLDQFEFRRYFKNENSSGEMRWDAVANSLQSNEFYLKEIIYYLRMFNEEIKFFRSSIYVHDPEVFDFLNRLSKEIIRMETTKPDYDDIKSFSGFLWSIFTGWSWTEGYRETDLIKDMIGRAK